MKRLALVILSGITLVACGTDSSEKEEKAPYMIADEAEPETEEHDEGHDLMVKHCYSCHNTENTGNMLAPPMRRVKDHYWDDDISEKEFVDSIVNWVKEPMEEKSIMPGARKKFGLMPKQDFDEEEVRKIATYIYNNDI